MGGMPHTGAPERVWLRVGTPHAQDGARVWDLRPNCTYDYMISPAQGKDCYLFGVSDDCVIDSTLRGTISRFAVRPTALFEPVY